jgi:hypothetical protein
MNWDKLKTNHYFKEPVEHIYSSTIFDLKEYDRLYENQNNLSHQSWLEFKDKYKVSVKMLDDIREIDKSKEILCIWFFKERTDRSGGEDILLSGKTLKYLPNTFLITESKLLTVLDKKDEYIRRPLVQINLIKSQYDQIVQRFR